jgi:hypothetical protein
MGQNIGSRYFRAAQHGRDPREAAAHSAHIRRRPVDTAPVEPRSTSKFGVTAMSVLLQMLGENRLPNSASCNSLQQLKFNCGRKWRSALVSDL